jgi:hypothetical protein
MEVKTHVECGMTWGLVKYMSLMHQTNNILEDNNAN